MTKCPVCGMPLIKIIAPSLEYKGNRQRAKPILNTYRSVQDPSLWFDMTNDKIFRRQTPFPNRHLTYSTIIVPYIYAKEDT